MFLRPYLGSFYLVCVFVNKQLAFYISPYLGCFTLVRVHFICLIYLDVRTKPVETIRKLMSAGRLAPGVFKKHEGTFFFRRLRREIRNVNIRTRPRAFLRATKKLRLRLFRLN